MRLLLLLLVFSANPFPLFLTTEEHPRARTNSSRMKVSLRKDRECSTEEADCLLCELKRKTARAEKKQLGNRELSKLAQTTAGKVLFSLFSFFSVFIDILFFWRAQRLCLTEESEGRE